MIKDKIIQKRMRGKVLAVAMTAVMASLFVPIRVDAAEIPDGVDFKMPITAASVNTKDVELTGTDSCFVEGVCQGHKVTETIDGPNSIIVKSGHHYIMLEGANITSTGGGAIEVENTASLTLVLSKNATQHNKLTGSTAGIYVAQDADFVVMSEDGKDDSVLEVKSTGYGAGIGGYGIAGDTGTCGGITIESGKIVAQGGNRGAGIGGSGFGSVATNKMITINKGTVIAKGGDGAKNTLTDADTNALSGAPGIGHGNKGSGGSVVINGGSITAIGGIDDSNKTKKTHASGISAGTITSKNSGGQTVLISDGISGEDHLSGLVWDLNRDPDTGALIDSKNQPILEEDFITTVLDNTNGVSHGHTCTVHNQAVMPSNFPEEFEKTGPNTLVIPSGTSFQIPAELDFEVTNGIISGSENSTMINPGNLKVKSPGTWIYGDLMNYRVSFLPTDVKLNEPFVYKGEAYRGDTLPKNEIFEVATGRRVQINGKWIENCPIDRTGLEHKYIKEGMDKTDPGVEVKDAGKYELVWSYGGKTDSIPFTVDRLDINSSEIEVANIDPQEYKGEVFAATDFDNGKVSVTYNKETLNFGTDYSVFFTQDYSEVGTAVLQIVGNGNFQGTRNKTFEITPVLLSDTNTEVTFNQGNSIKYDGNSHPPKVKDIKVTSSSGKEFTISTGFKTSDTCSAGEGNYTDAGDINIKITPTDKNFTGECNAKFVIEPRRLDVISVTPIKSEKKYDGTASVQISEIKIDFSIGGNNGEHPGGVSDGILSADRKEGLIEGLSDGVVELPVSLTGTLGENDAPLGEGQPAIVKEGGYNEVYLDTDMRLSGTKGRNYTVAGAYKVLNPDTFMLTSAITITKRDAPEIDITAVLEPDEANEPEFICNLELKGHEPKDVIDPDSEIQYYRYMGEGVEPEIRTGTLESLSWEGLSPNSLETFYVKIEGTTNVSGTEWLTYPVQIPKYPRKSGPPEGECSLTASETPNEDGESYKLTVMPEQKYDEFGRGVYLYSLSEDGEYYEDPSVLFDNVAPNSKYTAYIKYAETDSYTQSETATPTNEVETKEGEIQQPTVTCGETTASEGEIHFSGTANVTINYPGKLPGYEIRYTVDGGRPNNQSTLFTEPFTVTENTTINAFVIVPGAGSSKLTTVSLINDGGGNTPTTGMEVELQKLTVDSTPTLVANTDLPGKGFDSFEAISAPLATPILNQRGYENNNIIYADLKIKLKGTDRYATEEDFRNAKDGVIRVTITMDQLKALDLPQSYDATNHNFAVTHMFATGANAGNVEAIGSAHNYGKSSDGKSISFDMTSTSPVAFGWADINNSDPMPIDPNDPGASDPGTNDPGTNDPGTTDPGTTDPGTTDPGSNPTITADGEPRSGADGTTSNTDAGTQGASNDAANALSGIMPKTGDPLSFVPWIAAVVISIGAIAFFASKKSGKSKKAKTTKKKK